LLKEIDIFDLEKIKKMRRIAVVLMAFALLTMGACASSKPCPAYAKAMDDTEARG